MQTFRGSASLGICVHVDHEGKEKKTKKIGKRIREKEWRSMTICHCYRVPHQCEYMTSGPVYQKRRLRALAARSVKIVRFTGGWFNHKPVYCGDFLKTEP